MLGKHRVAHANCISDETELRICNRSQQRGDLKSGGRVYYRIKRRLMQVWAHLVSHPFISDR